MNIKDNDYIVGVWFGERSNKHNLMLTVKKTGKNAWTSEARLRTYIDNKIHNSEDKKTFWTINVKNQTEEEVIQRFNKLMESCRKTGFIDFYEYVEVKGDGEKFIFCLAMQPWANIRKEKGV